MATIARVENLKESKAVQVGHVEMKTEEGQGKTSDKLILIIANGVVAEYMDTLKTQGNPGDSVIIYPPFLLDGVLKKEGQMIITHGQFAVQEPQLEVRRINT
jgi:hypothetical protein